MSDKRVIPAYAYQDTRKAPGTSASVNHDTGRPRTPTLDDDLPHDDRTGPPIAVAAVDVTSLNRRVTQGKYSS
jgi:hypothetical protein